MKGGSERKRLCGTKGRPEMGEGKKEPYRAVVVAFDEEDGILFAKRSNSLWETEHILLDDIQRIMDDFDTEVTLKDERDGYGDWILTATPDLKKHNKMTYKVCFDKQESNVIEQEV